MTRGLLVGASLLATVSTVVYFSTRSNDSEVEPEAGKISAPEGQPAMAKPTGKVGWRLGLYEVVEGQLRQFGDGFAHTDTSGNVIALDIAFEARGSQARFVISDKGTFIGANSSGRNIWVDITESSGLPPVNQAIGVGRPGKLGSTPIRSVSSAGRRVDIFEVPGEAIVTATTSILSMDEIWIDTAKQIQRMVRFTYVTSKNVTAHSFVTIADRDDAVLVRLPPSLKAGDAIPAAVAIRRLMSLGRSSRAQREEVDPRFATEDANMRPFDGPPSSIQPAHFVLAQSTSLASQSPSGPTNNAQDVSFCEWEYRERTYQLPCMGLNPPPRLPPRPDLELVETIRSMTRESATSLRRDVTVHDVVTCGLAVAGGTFSLTWSAKNLIKVGLTRLRVLGYSTLLGFLMMATSIEFVDCIAGHLGIVNGDPHLTTFDGFGYGFQAVGEFVQLKSPGFEVQVRFEGEKGRNTAAVATAVRAGAHVVEVYFALTPKGPTDSSYRFRVVIDGSPKVVDFAGVSFSDGTYVVRRRGFTDRNLLIVDPAGSYVLVENLSLAQNVAVDLARGIRVTGGLGGMPDGTMSNDLTLRDGTVMSLSAVTSIKELYGRFAQSWRVRPNERLFTDGSAGDFLTEAYTSLPEAVTRLTDFSEAEIKRARSQCLKRGVAQGPQLDDCTYDVAVTGNVEWADQAAESAAIWSLTDGAPSVIGNAVSLEAPQSVAAGAAVEVKWEGPDEPGDFIIIAAPDTVTYPYHSPNHDTREGSPARLVAPVKPGTYQIRYFSSSKDSVLAHAPLRVTDAAVRLNAPQSVEAGAAVEVRWEGPDEPGDFIIIAAPDTVTQVYHSPNHSTREGTPARLVAPVSPGNYEIRYFSFANQAVLAHAPLRVAGAGVRMNAPESVTAGSAVEVVWQGPDEPGDFIIIAAPDTVTQRYHSPNHDTREGSPARLVAPVKPGTYEIRYFSFANDRVLARAPLRVTDAAVRLDAPESVEAGAAVEVRWEGPDAPGDFIIIAAPDTVTQRYHSPNHDTREGSPARLVAPVKPGTYKIRYFSFANQAVLRERAVIVR